MLCQAAEPSPEVLLALPLPGEGQERPGSDGEGP